ncbi:MAG: hypothetical protein KKB09_07110 [Nanoarchaeota archaeon]|nr:hypothetical protein [Nanoarchaeota archaeon]
MKLLKDVIQNKRQLRSAMNKPRMPLDTSPIQAVVFRTDGTLSYFAGFR